MQKIKLQWHPAFYAALQIELDADAPNFCFKEEHNLTRKPLQIDMLVIKEKGYHSRKSIARFFRGCNIIEYKSPSDYFSINDFYKVIGYACIYQSTTRDHPEVHPSDITVTIVCSQYPKTLIKYLKELPVDITQAVPGIYYIEKGVLFPLQIIVINDLPQDEYIWLSRLRTDLEVENDIQILSDAYAGKSHDPLYETVMDIIMRANEEKYKEAKGMCSALRELFAEEWSEKEKEFAEKELVFAEKQQDFAEKQQDFAEKQQDFAEKQQDFAEKQQDFAEKQQNFAEKQQDFAEKQQNFAEKQQALAEQQQDLEEKQKALANREQAVLERGLKALIEVCQSFNSTWEDTLDKVIQNFSLSPKEAAKCMKKYWL